jgi:hypothetical protein
MHVRQSKGKKHKTFIRLKAMRIWKAAKYARGLYGECLKTALEVHRLKVKQEIEKEINAREEKDRKEAERRQKVIREQLQFSCCDQNGWVG